MPKAVTPRQDVGPLVTRAHIALGMTQQEFGEALGVSRRTVTRWYKHSPLLTMEQLRTLARLVHPRDPELAAEIAWTVSESLESLGIVPPAPPPAPGPAAPAPLPTAVVVDSVVCAAAEALGVAPGAVRGALLAAFRRTRALRLSLQEVETALDAARGTTTTGEGGPSA